MVSYKAYKPGAGQLAKPICDRGSGGDNCRSAQHPRGELRVRDRVGSELRGSSHGVFLEETQCELMD